MIQVQSLHQLLNTWKWYKSISVRRLVAMFFFKSEANESLFSIPQKHIPTSSYIESQKSHDRQKKGWGESPFYPTPQKIHPNRISPPPRMAATPSKLCAVDPGATCPAIIARTPLSLRVGEGLVMPDLEFLWEKDVRLLWEYVKGDDLTYSTEFRCVWYICWYGIGAVLVFCSSLALLKTKGLLVWRLKEDVVLLLIIMTCVVQVWRGNFQVHKAIDEFR